MDHSDHVRLLRGGIDKDGGTWADLGSGTGAFTLALADLLVTGTIYSVDRDSGARREQARSMQRFTEVHVHYLTADFTDELGLPLLDGIVMANSLHFVKPERKITLLKRLREQLQPQGRLLLVEYDVDHGNTWVPYPLSYPSWERLAAETGFASTRQLATVPSRFLGRIYSAISVR
ncbi:MAG: class I SAM-dependent methyltransferase [Anaerolineae bacterium]